MEHEIEVFRADTRASRGLTAEHIAQVAEFDCVANPVGACFGHPKSNDPAAGLISGLRADGPKLFAKVKFTDAGVKGIKSGEYINRSMAFFHPDDEANPTPGKYAPRHLGFLGAAAPGIPGMGPLTSALAFAADGETLDVTGEPMAAWVEDPTAPTPIVFTAKERAPVTNPTEKTADELAFEARETALADREKAAALRIRTAFEATNAREIDALVLAGKVLPAEADALKLAFNAFDPEAEDLTFGAGDKATKASAAAALLSFMATALPKRVPLGDKPNSPQTEFNAADTAPTTGLDFAAKARKLATDEGITVDAAFERLAAA